MFPFATLGRRLLGGASILSNEGARTAQPCLVKSLIG